MQGGKAAAETAISMQATGDYSAASTSQYEQKWNHLYGYDFGKVSIDFPICYCHSCSQIADIPECKLLDTWKTA
jgi:hypothetical protein